MVFKKTDRNAVRLFLTSLIDVIAPRTCASCNSNLESDEDCICTLCYNQLKRTDDTLLSHEYLRKFAGKAFINSFNSLFIFEKDKELQNIIHSIKYRNRFLTAKALGEQAARLLCDELSKWHIDVIIPVPLHRLKAAERGYNQSCYIAKGLSSVMNIPYSNRMIKRIKYTASQTSMTLPEREQNITGAFKIKSTERIKGKNILLVDDVITTGATINECGRVLLNAGAVKVYAISLAIAE